MKKDELLEESHYEAARRHYRTRTGRFIDSEKPREFERKDAGRGRTAEEDRLLRDEDDAKTELPR
jgi:hypothetical protein